MKTRGAGDKFVGRGDKLAELEDSLEQGTAVAISALTGMGGIGKSELALQYALGSNKKDKYPAGICWVEVRAQNVGLQIVEYGRSYLDLAAVIPDGELQTQVDFCYRNWRQGEALIVFDDVVDYDKIKPYLPPIEPRFKVLLTTRQKLGSPVQRLDLDVLSLPDAMALLTEYVTDGRVTQEKETAEKLCEWLGCLPLAIEIMGRYLAEDEDLSLGELLEELGEVRLGAELFQTKYPEMTATREVVAAFGLSWNRLSETAQELARLLSLFAAASIPWKLVEETEIFEKRALKNARKELVKLNLLKRTAEKSYELHSLIREYFQQQEPTDSQRQTVCRALVQFAEQISEVSTKTQITEWEPSIPHLAEVANKLNHWLGEADLYLPYRGLAAFYLGKGIYNLAQYWCVLGKDICEKHLGADHPNVATSLNNLAELYRLQGKYDDAEPLYMRSLLIWEKQLGVDHLYVATNLNNLGLLYYAQEKYDKAKPIYRRALSILEKHLRADHPRVAQNMNNLGLLCYAQRKYDEAEPLYKQALSIREKQSGADHPDVAQIINNLAALYNDQGKYDAAEPLFKRALSIREKQLGTEHPDVAQSLNNLAVSYYFQGNYGEAEPLFKRALSIREKQLGTDHPQTIINFNSIVELYRFQGRYAEAELIYQRSLSIMEKQLGEEHPQFAASLNNLAALYDFQGKYAEAEPLLRRSLSIREKQLGSDHPDVASSLNNLAALYESQGNNGSAEPLYRRAVEIAEKKLGSEHPDTKAYRQGLENVRRAMSD
ncbi:MAG: tetratricopeptide repeat protein [Limnothrix sp.]